MSHDLRPEHCGDEVAIAAVISEAFAGAAHASGTEASIVDSLRSRGALTVSLVAETGGVVVGHVAISPVTVRCAASEEGTAPDRWYGLGPVAVRPGLQRHGVGSGLVRAALQQIAAEQGCVVLGDPRFYGRFGFRAAPWLVLPGAPPGCFQALLLTAAVVPEGAVAYDPAFDVT